MERYQAVMLGLVLLPAQLAPACLSLGQLFLTAPCPGGPLSAVHQWDPDCERPWLSYFSLFCFYMAGFLGQAGFVVLSHRTGLRPGYFALLGLQTIAGAASSLAPTLAVFVTLQAFAAVGASGCSSLTIALGQSLVPLHQRSRVWFLSMVARSVGMMLVSLLVVLVPDWTGLSLATSLPFLTFFLYCWILPESPAVLLRQKRHEDLLQLLHVMARTNEVSDIDGLRKQLTNTNPSTTAETDSPKLKRVILAIIWASSSTVTAGLTVYSLELDSEARTANFALGCGAELLGWGAGGLVSRPELAFLSAGLAGAACLAVLTRPRGSRQAVGLLTAARFLSTVSLVSLPARSPYRLETLLGLVALPPLLYVGRIKGFVPLLVLGILQLACGVLILVLPEDRSPANPAELQEPKLEEEDGPFQTSPL